MAFSGRSRGGVWIWNWFSITVHDHHDKSLTMTDLTRFLFIYFFQGCQEDHDPFEKDYPPWTAYRSEDYGYTRMTIFNETHLFMDQVNVDKVCRLGIKPLFLVACEKTFCYGNVVESHTLVACKRKREWDGRVPFLCLLWLDPWPTHSLSVHFCCL